MVVTRKSLVGESQHRTLAGAGLGVRVHLLIEFSLGYNGRHPTGSDQRNGSDTAFYYGIFCRDSVIRKNFSIKKTFDAYECRRFFLCGNDLVHHGANLALPTLPFCRLKPQVTGIPTGYRFTDLTILPFFNSASERFTIR
jgi:hypothetical protein